jgi:hypothetical protein
MRRALTADVPYLWAIWHGYCCGPASSADECRTIVNPDSYQPTQTSEGLRALATWYRDYAEQAGSPVIWDYRLSTAEDLERQASDLERQGSRSLAA